ncbi:MAG: hypothetical protein M1812_006643 [Candelaria pacifica]|nr:MAG: hypothetical protein M1812_006643 [Candelaria pacifica]
MEREIPGYYFADLMLSVPSDREKKKYFKIIPNHVAPKGAQYSRENVKKSRENERKRKRDDEKAHRIKQQVQRSEILNHPLGGAYYLNRETGTQAPQRGIRAKTYVHGLERSTTFCTGESSRIQHFARDEATGGLFYGCGFQRLNQLKCVTPDRDGNGKITYSESRAKPISSPTGSEITSINIGPTRTLVSTSLGGDADASIMLTKLVEPGQFDGTWLDVGVHMILHPREQTIWTSGTSKHDGTIAIGTSTGVLLLKETDNNWTESRALKSNTDIFALEFLSPSTIAAGGRDSSIQLYDQRSSGKALRLRHPSSVTGIRQVDDWRVVVCGLRGSMRMYDLRAQPGAGKKGEKATPPVLEYLYSNAFRLGLGFDVDTETGLVVAASEDKTLQLFSLHSGEEIRPKASDKTFSDFAGCVRFSQPKDQEHRSKELLVSAGNALDCFSW